MPSIGSCKAILPQRTRTLIDEIPLASRHAGLQLDKLSSADEQKEQRGALEKATKTLRDPQILKALFERRRLTLDALGAARLPMTTHGSLTLHQPRSGALENAGIALHPVYGFVHLPGSGIKGLTRAWAETVWASAQPDKEAAWRKIERAFGWSPGSERHKKLWRPDAVKPPADAAAGRLVFHDAWPLRWPHLILDVVNNHHGKYYGGEDDPGDWEYPIPVYFLAVRTGEPFEFAISDRRPGDDGLLSLACDWLKDALVAEGAGAKTAAGYGRFKSAEGETPAAISPDFAAAGFASASFDLKLVTPAFLAGASQQKDDCDLRPATLRGLLRWWWRTMHAGHLDRNKLKRLETAVWGDPESGSPVRVAVDLVEDGQPRQYDYRDKRKTFQFQPNQEFKHRHDLQPPNRKTTQGLFYASYGMDDGTKEKRWFRPAGATWRVTVTARSGRLVRGKKEGLCLSADSLLLQAKAALWLLCRFGGVGSRGRKGFGSFEDIQLEGIASVQDCKERAQAFRETCRLDGDKVDEPHLSALEQVGTIEVATPWKNPWTALDQLGFAVQAFAQKYAHKEEKKALGLPRKIHGPRDGPMAHQSYDTHEPPLELSAVKGKRHAAPIHYHLAAASNGTLLIRVATFPARWLPGFDESKGMLDELRGFLEGEIRRRTESYKDIGQKAGPPKRSTPPPEPIDSAEARRLGLEQEIAGLRGKGDVSKMPEIVKRIAQLSDPTARDSCVEQLEKWLKQGGKKSLWKDKKHANTEWRQQLNELL